MSSSVMALFDRLKTLLLLPNLANDTIPISLLIYNEEIKGTNYDHLNRMHNGRKKHVRVLNAHL